MKNKSFSSVFLIILSFIVILGLLSNLFNFISIGDNSFTFKNFLDILGSYESVLPNFTIKEFVINADWGIFNFLRNIFEFFGNIFSILGFLALNLLNLLKFILHFVVNLFFV